MTDCPKCDQHTERVNAEPKRVVMLVVWLETDKPHVGREPELESFWASLPDDGWQAIKGYYNHRNPSNNAPLGFNLSGCDFYFMARAVDGELIVGGDTNTTREELERRYPGAVVKCGKWTSPANIDRINAEVAAWR